MGLSGPSMHVSVDDLYQTDLFYSVVKGLYTGYGIFGDVENSNNMVSSPHAQLVYFDGVFIHPGFSRHPVYPSVDEHDVALLHFKRPVDITDFVRPVCLTRVRTEIETFENCWATGQGYVRPWYNIYGKAVGIAQARIRHTS